MPSTETRTRFDSKNYTKNLRDWLDLAAHLGSFCQIHRYPSCEDGFVLPSAISSPAGPAFRSRAAIARRLLLLPVFLKLALARTELYVHSELICLAALQDLRL